MSIRLSCYMRSVSRREAERGGPKYPRQRSVGRAGRCGGAAALAGGKERERERERDLFLRGGRQEVAWRGKGSSPRIYALMDDARMHVVR